MQSTQSTLCADPDVIGVLARGTDSRNVVITAPLGSSRSTGAEETRPRSSTALSVLSPLSAATFSVISDHLRARA